MFNSSSMKKTLVLGASPNPERYGYKATQMLSDYGHPVLPYGIRKGSIGKVSILDSLPQDTDIDTVTLYLNPANQKPYEDYIVGLKPRRVIFNPGTENDTFEEKLRAAGIEPVEACTLVMLRCGQF
jgi:predicted CoA-binding protein